MANSGKAITTYLKGKEATRFEAAVKATGKTPYALAAYLISSGLDAMPGLDETQEAERPRRRRRRAAP